MRITVSNVLTVEGLDDLQDEQLARRWEVDNPAYLQAERQGRWTGAFARRIAAGTFSGWRGSRLVTLPRGLLAGVLEVYPLADVRLDLDEPLATSPGHALTLPVTLRPYQQVAVEALCRHDVGYLVAPCGSGKTVMGLEVIRRRGLRTLVLVHTVALLEQWTAEIRAMLGEWGRVNVTVATVQSLWGTVSRAEKPLPPHGLLVMDEAHHAPSRCFSEVVGRSRARCRYGLTATPIREDGLSPLLDWTFGGARHVVDRADLIDAGQLVTPRYEVIRTGCSPEAPTTWNRARRESTLDFTGLVTMLAEDNGRTRLVADLAVGSAAGGHVVLVLTTRVDHADAVARACDDLGAPAHVVTGSASGKKRAERLADVREGRVRILIATQLADEGLDLPILDVCILALPSRAEGRTIQRVGRIMRPAPGKGQPVVYDLVDNVGACYAQQKARKRAFDKACGVA
jgi:superfamily II DNA or RNA helicase